MMFVDCDGDHGSSWYLFLVIGNSCLLSGSVNAQCNSTVLFSKAVNGNSTVR